MNDRHTQEIEVRIDKWLWSARFFKTRALAAEAIAGGKVALNGARPKPSRIICVGVTSTSVVAFMNWTIIVKGTSTYRRPASEAQTLYEETEESKSSRQAVLAQLKLERPGDFHRPRRPSKKDRRAISKFTNRR